MKIRWLSNSLCSLKNRHKQFSQAFRPPTPTPFGQCPNSHVFGGGASLSQSRNLSCDLCAKGNHKGQLNNHIVIRKDFLQKEIDSNRRSVTGHFCTFASSLLVQTVSRVKRANCYCLTFPFLGSMLSYITAIGAERGVCLIS